MAHAAGRVLVLCGAGAFVAAAAPPPQLRGASTDGSVACTSSDGVDFTCGAGSACCGDACVGEAGTCCKGLKGVAFPCGQNSSCCGDACMAGGGTCCENELGVHFPCASGGQCCGNTCAAGGDKCCADSHGTRYAVSAQSPCMSEMKNCTNSRGVTFFCGEGSECCGDGCMAPGAVCCTNNAGLRAFSCGYLSQCCGSACAAPGSRCCEDKKGNHYPVAGGYEYPWEMGIYANCKAA